MLNKKIPRTHILQINDSLLVWCLFAIAVLFFVFHVATINNPYFNIDEALYRVAGSYAGIKSLDSGYVWRIFYLFTSHLSVENYRYTCAFYILIISCAIIYTFSEKGLIKTGILSVLILLSCPLSFVVFHFTRPEMLHTALAMMCVAFCTKCYAKNKFYFPTISHQTKRIMWPTYAFLSGAMLTNLLLPHTHMFGIVHMPATYFLIIVAIVFLPLNLFSRIVLLLFFTCLELGDIFYFLNNSPKFPSSGNYLQRISLAFMNIFNTPHTISTYDTAVRNGNIMPKFLIQIFSRGNYLIISTSILLVFGFFGALVSVARCILIKAFDFTGILGASILIFLGTLLAATIQMGYINFSYSSTMIPWASMGFGLGVLFLFNIHELKGKKNYFLSKYLIKKMALFTLTIGPIGLVTIMVLFGVGQVYTFSWPLRDSSFANIVNEVNKALLENNCVDLPYISAPYRGFINMHPNKKEMSFAPDFATTFVTNLSYIYDSSPLEQQFGSEYGKYKVIERLNRPGACLVVSQMHFYFITEAAPYDSAKIAHFFHDNFTVVKDIKIPFFSHDPFAGVIVTKYQHDMQVGAPYNKQGGVEEVFILKPNKKISENLINEYV